MGLKVYFDLMSQPSRAVVLFLRANNISFEEKPVALRKGEHFSDEFAKLNPMKKVPVIDDDGFVLTESIAGLKYLCGKYSLAAHWYPAQLQERARVDEYLAWYHLNTRIYSSVYFRTKMLDPVMKNIPVDQEKLRHYKTQLETMLDFMESYFLRDQMYLCGNDITIADVMAVCELMQTCMAAYDCGQGRPKIAAWMTRVKSRLQPHFDNVHEFVYKSIDKFGGVKPKI